MEAVAKTILFGEHAVVYGHPGIAVPITSFTTRATIKESDVFSFRSDRIIEDYEKERLGRLIEYLLKALKIKNKESQD